MLSEQTLPIFFNIQLDCQYYDEITQACSLWGSPECKKCTNYIPNEKRK